MVFTVISFAPGLDRATMARARAAAPPRTESPAPYELLLAERGFRVLGHEDVSTAFGRITGRDLAAYEARAEAVTQAMGETEYAARLSLRRDRVAAIEAGLLRREIFVACVAAT